MDIRTFRASSLQAALKQVRETLGPDASVVQTREVKKNRLGLFPGSAVEVDAYLTKAEPPTSSQTKPSPTPHVPSQEDSRIELPAADGSNIPHQSQLHEPAPVPPNTRLPEPAHRFTNDSANPNSSLMGDAALEVLSELMQSGIESALARELLVDAAARCSDADRRDPWLLRISLMQSVARKLNVSGALSVDPEQQTVAAFVGPTGVGKTTTLAKIAAGFRFDVGCQVGLITMDTFRLGAVDQLLQYAEMLSAPLEVVSSPGEVTPALARLRECDLVLIDTAGRAPGDIDQINQLAEMLDAAEPDSTQLVLSATSSLKHAHMSMERFTMLQPDGMVLTKLDEIHEFGSWLPLLMDSNLPVSYLTSGQHVPQDLSIANVRRLSRELLGMRAEQIATN